MTNLYQSILKQFLKHVNLRKTSPTNLIFNAIEKINVYFTEKKHTENEPNINKLLLFLP